MTTTQETPNFETGAKTWAVNDLILFTENTQDTYNLMLETFKTEGENCIKNPYEAFRKLFRYAQNKYISEFNTESSLHIINLTEEERKDFCQLYAKDFKRWKEENKEEYITGHIKHIIENSIPEGCYINICQYSILGGKSLKIFFAASDKDINGVREQKPQAVSLRLDFETLELNTQVFGGMGGNRIYREVNKEDAKEKYLAMVGIKIPFRQPQKTETAVFKAVQKFAENWVKAIQENREKLTHQKLADYSNF